MVRMRLVRVGIVTMALWGMAAVDPAAAALVKPAVPWDVNGDGYAELALAADKEDVSTGRPSVRRRDAGAVTLLKGSVNGPVTSGATTITQETAGVIGDSESGDEFGSGMTSCDFNRDGYADLVIGAYGETAPGDPEPGTRAQGAVSVLYGSAKGLQTRGFDLFGPGEFTLLQEWGAALECGDLTGDGYPDLVIGGVATTFTGAGGVSLFFGASSGLSSSRVRHLTRAGAGFPPGDGDPASTWGRTLAVGDTNNDGRDDVVVGGDGHIYVLIGRATGGVATPARRIRFTDTALEEQAVGPLGTAALAIGDFNRNGYADIAASVNDVRSPKCVYEYEETFCPDGVVVIDSRSGGLNVAGAKLWWADAPGVAGVADNDDDFGLVLAAGDLNKDGRDDLAVGAPNKDVGAATSTGGVTMLYGSTGGLTANGSEVWTQDSPRVPGENETLDRFGSGLLISALRGSTGNGLTIAIPRESVGTSRPQAGVATVLFGITSGLTANRAQLWSQSSPGVPGAAEEGDCFGFPRAGSTLPC